MKTLLTLLGVLLVVVVAVGAVYGWIVFEKDGDRARVEVNTRPLQEAADEAAVEGRQALNRVGELLREAGDEMKERVDELHDNLHDEHDDDADEGELDAAGDDFAPPVPSRDPLST